MTCRIVATGPGFFAISCGRSEKVKPCGVPGCGRPHRFLCDHPIAGGKTCSAPLCAVHRTEIEDDKDLCPPHARARSIR